MTKRAVLRAISILPRLRGGCPNTYDVGLVILSDEFTGVPMGGLPPVGFLNSDGQRQPRTTGAASVADPTVRAPRGSSHRPTRHDT